jgi:hypothetical protein
MAADFFRKAPRNIHFFKSKDPKSKLAFTFLSAREGLLRMIYLRSEAGGKEEQ